MNLASSYASSKSFLKYDDSDLRDSRVPDVAETLPTGFRMILDENLVANVWKSEKQRETLQDLLVLASYPDQIHAKRRHPPQFREDGADGHR